MPIGAFRLNVVKQPVKVSFFSTITEETNIWFIENLLSFLLIAADPSGEQGYLLHSS